MKINKKDLKLTLEEKNVDVKNLYTGNVLTYAGVNHSGSFIGSAEAEPINLFVKIENGQYAPLTHILWGKYLSAYVSIDDNPLFVESVLINVKPFAQHCEEVGLDYRDIKTLKDLFATLKTLNNINNERKPR